MNAFQNIILDLAIAAVMIVSAVRGARRGFVLMLASFLKVIIALVGSVLLTVLLAPRVADAVEPAIEERVLPPIMQLADETGALVDSSLESVEDVTVFGIRIGAYFDAAGTAAAEDRLAESAAHTISVGVADTLARSVVGAASFVLLLIAVTLIAHALDLAFRLPLLGGINHVLGLLVGTASGAVFVLLLVTVAEIFVSPAVADNTVLFSFVRDLNPFSLH